MPNGEKPSAIGLDRSPDESCAYIPDSAAENQVLAVGATCQSWEDSFAADARAPIRAPAAQPQAPVGDRGEAALRLDKRTYLDQRQGTYIIQAHDYGGGLCEIGWSFVGSIVFSKAGRGQSEERDVHEMRAIRRARSRIRRLVLSANADHLLTLTYQANVTDIGQASADLGRFIRQVKPILPGWVYIAVPERQKRGAWHWHLAVIGRQDVDLLRTAWRDVVGKGNIDVQPSSNRTANRRLAIVKYLGKYLAKGFQERDRELNKHRYRASLGIQIPSQSIEIPPEHSGDITQYVREELQARAGAVGFVWTGEYSQMGWACSWS